MEGYKIKLHYKTKDGEFEEIIEAKDLEELEKKVQKFKKEKELDIKINKVWSERVI